jgi:hypothetical protein
MGRKIFRELAAMVGVWIFLLAAIAVVGAITIGHVP